MDRGVKKTATSIAQMIVRMLQDIALGVNLDGQEIFASEVIF